MNFAKTFFASISIMITLAYIFNIGYKYIFQHASVRVKYGLTIAVFIIGGWFAMLFGIRVHGVTLLDLRFVPSIVAVLVFPNPWVIIGISSGIGVGRLFFGTDLSAWTGVGNMILTGFACAALHIWLKRMTWRFVWKSAVTILIVNVVYALLAIFSMYVTKTMTITAYWNAIGVYVFPVRIVLCALFVFIIRDFQKEQLRVDELRTMNMLLRRQTSELRQAKRDVEEKARELLQASKYKSEFLANMSHELKTPLNSVILLSQLIHDNDEGRYEGDEVNYAELIHVAGNDLLQLINDILDLSKVEAGKMDVNFEQVSTHELVQLLHQQYLPLADQKKLAFETDISASVPVTLMTDALRVNQILRNLLVNAFKFTETGSVKLTVRLEGGAKAIESGQPGKGRTRTWNLASWGRHAARPIPPQRISFTVADTGIGIEPEKQELIFEAFRQEDGAINRKYGGTGLGLSISLQLARLLGGSLKLKSEKNKGSSFTLYLPMKPPVNPAEEVAEQAAVKRTGK
ncbi:ATP-binding protein [Paenibacillus mendelii]|uniref:histidine kinase n=1 Tax=Paenibacillus mendelii TaxID=206163 RepID=A0ABV6JDY3_9BACL|nr:ATP-binding protein [Paenibacillus mendelii]MCQ6562474.1 ATP-binding protein [Paenibacillus mendelii]